MKNQENMPKVDALVDALFCWAEKLDYTIQPDIQLVKSKISNVEDMWNLVAEDNQKGLRYVMIVDPNRSTNTLYLAAKSLIKSMLIERLGKKEISKIIDNKETTKNIDYVEVMYALAEELHFKVQEKKENIIDKRQGIKTSITQFSVEDIDGNARFFINIGQHGRTNNVSEAAKTLIMAMHRERDIPFDESTLIKYAHSINQPLERKDTREISKVSAATKDPEITPLTAIDRKHAEVSSQEYPNGGNKKVKEQIGNSTTKNPIKIVEKYKVSNSSRSFTRNQCPECSGQVILERRNIPVFAPDGNFHQYYICNVWICKKCHETFMTTIEWKNLQMRLSGSTRKLFAKPSNMRRVKKNNDYLYEPIEDHSIYMTKQQVKNLPSVQTQSDIDPFSTMQAKSFMKEAGYSTSVSADKRRAILKKLVKDYGKRQVSDYLKTFITLHRRRRNYANAVAVWQSDLNYIARL